MFLLFLATTINDSIYVRRPSKGPYYTLLGASALSLALGGSGVVIGLTAKDERTKDLGTALFVAGGLLFTVSTTLARFMYGDYRGGTISCCIKGGACVLLTGASVMYDSTDVSLPVAVGTALSYLACLTSSIYDAMEVHNIANMKVKLVEVVRYDTVSDTVYDTVRVKERDTVVVVRVVRKVERYRYRRRITAGDRERAKREYRLGLEAYARDDLVEALRHFERALEYDPTYEKAREAVRRLRSRLQKR